MKMTRHMVHILQSYIVSLTNLREMRRRPLLRRNTRMMKKEIRRMMKRRRRLKRRKVVIRMTLTLEKKEYINLKEELAQDSKPGRATVMSLPLHKV